MMEVIDAGHKYRLLTLDGSREQILTFVKRCDFVHPERFPGNINAYEGTTLQSVIRCLLDRMYYLQKQVACGENKLIILFLRTCLWLLEKRAANRHGRSYRQGLHYAEFAPLCPQCGHTQCEHQDPVESKIVSDFYLRRRKF